MLPRGAAVRADPVDLVEVPEAVEVRSPAQIRDRDIALTRDRSLADAQRVGKSG